jgi:hypothetical protein
LNCMQRLKPTSALLSLFSNYRLACFSFPPTHPFYARFARFLMNINSRGKAFFLLLLMFSPVC